LAQFEPNPYFYRVDAVFLGSMPPTCALVPGPAAGSCRDGHNAAASEKGEPGSDRRLRIKILLTCLLSIAIKNSFSEF
jgi:hypothetical protein